ncbi:MAG: hypothetical protein ABS58_07010 [Mesorhizobium sp. SCN 65-20]|nr:MAG: hypothetical protein ABS58_07010 [Mesorhizobium sp. SCN 65-20]
MKILLLAGVSALVLSLGLARAHAADPAAVDDPVRAEDLWYVSLFGGASFPSGLETERSGVQFDPDLDTGFLVGATVGRRINDAFRVEAELSYARYKTDRVNYSNGSYDLAGGDLSATYLLANVWADVTRLGEASVYVGGGLGAAYVDGDIYFSDPSSLGYGSSEWGFAGQLGAGVTYAVAQNVDLDFGYRFKAVTGLDFQDRMGGADFADGDLYTHNLQFGVTARF